MIKLFRWAVVLGSLLNIYLWWGTNTVYGWIVALLGWLLLIKKEDQNGN
jgi:hypothetical protein